MMLAQSIVKKWIRNEWTLTHAVHEVATYKTWNITGLCYTTISLP